MYNKNKSILTPPYSDKGFTLAETLITLVIVGVVAALTVPTMIVKYQKEQTVTKLKKAYSALSQTTNRAISDNGPITTWELGEHHSGEAAHEFVKKYMFPYLSVMKDCGNDITGKCAFYHKNKNKSLYSTDNQLADMYTRFYLADGTFVAMNIDSTATTSRTIIKVDINGQKEPNTLGRDIFEFNYYLKDVNSPEKNGKLIPYSYERTRDVIVGTSYASSCNKERSGAACAALIMKDGWKIADDYPW